MSITDAVLAVLSSTGFIAMVRAARDAFRTSTEDDQHERTTEAAQQTRAQDISVQFAIEERAERRAAHEAIVTTLRAQLAAAEQHHATASATLQQQHAAELAAMLRAAKRKEEEAAARIRLLETQNSLQEQLLDRQRQQMHDLVKRVSTSGASIPPPPAPDDGPRPKYFTDVVVLPKGKP